MRTLSAIILAAGKGTRMNSDLPKVAHRVCGRAMVEWVADACFDAGCSRVVIVVGYQQDVVRGLFSRKEEVENRRDGRDARPTRLSRDIEFAVQAEQHGTGHAVRCADSLFAREKIELGHDVFVLAGDGPLIRSATLRTLLDRHRSTSASATLATAVIDDPSGYGRIVRDGAGRFSAIVEQKNATPAQLKVREVNPSYYCFDAKSLFGALERVKRDPVGGEYYITDAPALLMADGKRVEVIDAVPAEDVLSINTPAQLADVERIMIGRGAGQPGKGRAA
jgi:bifunctional UDP-N-acetylglucosamine pyrophosphorylase / glucosamine-1-phosphate N-acetyltransferase